MIALFLFLSFVASILVLGVLLIKLNNVGCVEFKGPTDAELAIVLSIVTTTS